MKTSHSEDVEPNYMIKTIPFLYFYIFLTVGLRAAEKIEFGHDMSQGQFGFQQGKTHSNAISRAGTKRQVCVRLD
jgi:hypothetical protein